MMNTTILKSIYNAIRKKFHKRLRRGLQKTEYNCYDFEENYSYLWGAGFLGSLFVKYFLYLMKSSLTHVRLFRLIIFSRKNDSQIEDQNLINVDHDLINDLSLKLHKERLISYQLQGVQALFYERFPIETRRYQLLELKPARACFAA